MDRVEITSTASADTVFGILTDWPRHREWMPFTRAEGGDGVGAPVRGWTGIGPIGFWDTMVITEWVPGRKVATRHTGRIVRGDAWFETHPLPAGGCSIVWVERLPFSPGPPLRLFMRAGLRRLARLAERHELS